MTGLHDDMDRFERRALELEVEQRHRFEAQGSHTGFMESRYEQMQLFLIGRYRESSKTYVPPKEDVRFVYYPTMPIPIPRPYVGSTKSTV